MSQTTIIAIGGDNLIDRVQIGVQNGAPVFANNPGGSSFNVAVALSRQGAATHFLTPISTDAMGDLLADRLTKSGVVIAAPRRVEPTTLAIVTLDNGIPVYEFKREGTAERCVTEASLKELLPNNTAAFHVGSIALTGGEDAAEWEAFFHSAKKSGIFTSLDPNVRASLIDDREAFVARLMRMFKSADLIKLSDEDLAWLFPDMTLDKAFASLNEAAAAALVVMTKGPEGAEAKTATHHVKINAPKVNDLKDTIGAGDTFTGTLLATLAAQDALDAKALSAMTEDGLAALLARAAKAAALNCEQEGCNPPTLSVLDAGME